MSTAFEERNFKIWSSRKNGATYRMIATRFAMKYNNVRRIYEREERKIRSEFHKLSIALKYKKLTGAYLFQMINPDHDKDLIKD